MLKFSNDETSHHAPRFVIRSFDLRSLIRSRRAGIIEFRHLHWVLLLTLLLLAGCYEEKQAVTVNPDGSGKVAIVMDVAVPLRDAPGKEKPTAASFGRQMATTLINGTRGVEAWADLAISEAPDGRAHVETTAYFRDINQLHFDMPLEFHWERDIDGAVLTVQRTRTAVNTSSSMKEEEIRDLVAKAKAQYKEQQLALRTQLAAFKLTLTFVLPGELDGEHLMTRDGNSATVSLDGKKAADALDAFMADDAALAATFRRGKDTQANDDIMLKSMYGQIGPVKVHSKFKLEEKPQFDYKTEVTIANLRMAQMLKDSGVDLVQKFTVKEAETAPATGRGN